MTKTEETWMDGITTEMMEHICDNLCKYPNQLSGEQLEDKCAECKMGRFVCDILNHHNKVVDAGNAQCAKLMCEIRYLKERDTAKRPIAYSGTNRADCPICGATVRGIGKPFGEFCGKCGQRLDWGE